MKSYIKRLIYFICSLAIAPFVLFLKFGNLFSRTDTIFSGQAQLLSLIPGKLGSYLRIAYYHLALENCPLEGYIGFGSFFSHPEASVGRGVYIGAYCIIGKAVIGKDVTIGSGVHILSGRHQHKFDIIDGPIQEQGGEFKKLSIGENCWIGNGSIIMADVGRQNIIGAGSIIVKQTGDYEVWVGNPGRLLKNLKEVRKSPAYSSGGKDARS